MTTTALAKTNGNHVTRYQEPVDAEIIERVLIVGDLRQLTPNERVRYYRATCASIGLNPMTKPFEYINLNNKLTLYATKNCTDQLREKHEVSVTKLERTVSDGLSVVTARARTASGREDEDIGAVSIGNLKGEALANALMKACTKAKRRVTLSICGLSFPDESEIDAIPGARRIEVDHQTGVIAEPSRPALVAAEPETRDYAAEIEAKIRSAADADELDAAAAWVARADREGKITSEQVKVLAKLGKARRTEVP